MDPFIFLKAEGGALKEADWAKKRQNDASKEQWSAIWNCVIALGAAETQKMCSGLWELPACITTPLVTPMESYKQGCNH